MGPNNQQNTLTIT